MIKHTDISHRCPVCDAPSALLDVVDFNKSCEELRDKFLPLSGVPVYYAICSSCAFAFAPEFATWRPEQFAAWIYNDDYISVDPDYAVVRPQANANAIVELLGEYGRAVRHLDYGGGSGLMSDMLRDSGWQSQSYDPFVDHGVEIESLGRFDLVTAYEVFEHVPDVRRLAGTISSLLTYDGVVLFSTLLSDGNLAPNQRLSWWYAAPRNGHISLFSRKSLSVLAASEGFSFGSFSANFHAYWRTVPPWARHFLGNA